MKRRTLRGTLTGNEKRRLVVDDGQLTQGYLVKEFHVWSTSLSGGRNAEMVLSLNEDIALGWRAEDSRQIGWGAMITDAVGDESLNKFSLLDPDHIILRDLWIQSLNADDANYMVVLEKIELTDNQSILTLIKEDRES